MTSGSTVSFLLHYVDVGSDGCPALLLAYGISTATTLIPTLSALYHDNSVPALTASENVSLFGSYVPFLLIPLGIAVDMSARLITIIGKEGKLKTD